MTGNSQKTMGAMGQVNTPEPTTDRSVQGIDCEEEEKNEDPFAYFHEWAPHTKSIVLSKSAMFQ